MGFFSDIGNMFSGPAAPLRIAADIMTFGGNEILGNPVGNMFFPPNPNKDMNYWNQVNYDVAQQNIALAKEFAQNGISWRIADAAKNGIAPLAALGASTPSYSPVSVAFSSAPVTSAPGEIGRDIFSSVGQNATRALLATKSPAVRTAEVLAVARAEKENKLLDVQYAQALFNLAKSASPGIPLAYQEIRNRNGSISVVPSDLAASVSHGQFGGGVNWSLNNGLYPELQRLPQLIYDLIPDKGSRGSRLLELDRNSRNLP